MFVDLLVSDWGSYSGFYPIPLARCVDKLRWGHFMKTFLAFFLRKQYSGTHCVRGYKRLILVHVSCMYSGHLGGLHCRWTWLYSSWAQLHCSWVSLYSVCMSLCYRWMPLHSSWLPLHSSWVYRCIPAEYCCNPVECRCTPAEYLCIPAECRCTPALCRCIAAKNRCIPAECWTPVVRWTPFERRFYNWVDFLAYRRTYWDNTKRQTLFICTNNETLSGMIPFRPIFQFHRTTDFVKLQMKQTMDLFTNRNLSTITQHMDTDPSSGVKLTNDPWNGTEVQ